MRVGLYVAYWPWFSAEEQIALAEQADGVGLDSVWVAEAWGQDAVSVLGHLSAKTERIGLGSALMQIPARTPAATAMTAATLDVLSGGRFRLGLGVSGPQVSEGWHGVPFRRPLARTREYVEIVRRALAREAPLEYDGQEFKLPLEGSELGKPLKLLAKPVSERIPIYLGAIGPKAIEQTAQIADGWIPFMFNPERAPELLKPFEGTGVDIAPAALICVDEDRDRARDLARPWLATYLGAMGAKEKNFYVETAERFGHGDAAREVQRLFGAGDREGAARALTPELIDGSAICCDYGELDQRLAAYERAGADTLLALPFGDRPRIVEALGAAVPA
ncbi:MAG: LLM class F420-dependent oxidoreductase [Thermoleophilaceae bacterium]|nr:LLM class F420-dependent oxidoreductase [Thermoleophilaceae bacterium]